MLLKYTFDLTTPIISEDHWPIRAFGGQVRLVEQAGVIKAVEICFPGQPVSLAPSIEQTPNDAIKANITFNDGAFFSRAERALRLSLAHIQCFFPVQLASDNSRVDFIAESAGEREEISLYNFSREKRDSTLRIRFDMLARAMWAAEAESDPSFAAALVVASRDKLNQKEYINSFRYAFLLIESEYGAGQFKTKSLKARLKSSAELQKSITDAVESSKSMRLTHPSVMKDLIMGGAEGDAIIDELVDKRGFYFHAGGNNPGAWRPQDQREGEALAILCSFILTDISSKFAQPMFEQVHVDRYMSEATQQGAILKLEIHYKYKEADVPFERDGVLIVNTPGTKVTARIAMEAAATFLTNFRDEHPYFEMQEAHCRTATGQKVFDFVIHPSSQAVEV